MTAAAVIVAAGKGERFGNASKVLAELLHRPVLAWSLDAFQMCEAVDEIVLVAGEHTREAIIALVDTGPWSKVTRIVAGGDTRQQSTANGVAAVTTAAEIILVHDAARPLVLPVQIDTCIATAHKSGGAILAAPVTDTIKRVVSNIVTETVDRSTLWAAQTPQAFRTEIMREMMLADSENVTDEASLAEYLGYTVQIVPSDSSNLKITHPADIAVAESLILARKEPHT